MLVTMQFLPEAEQLKLQTLNRWWYEKGVCRVQLRVPASYWCFLTEYDAYRRVNKLDNSRLCNKVVAFCSLGNLKLLSHKGSENLTNAGWVSCQVGKDKLFQCRNFATKFRVLHLDAAAKTFSVSRTGENDLKVFDANLVCYNGRFIFVFGHGSGYVSRFDLIFNEWQHFPFLQGTRGGRYGCCLGDTLYLFKSRYGGTEFVVEGEEGYPKETSYIYKFSNLAARKI